MIIFKGTIKKRESIVSVMVDENGHIAFSPQGEYRCIIDTGFAGDIAVPYSMLPRLDHKFLGYDEFVLATNKRIQLPVFQGWVRVKKGKLKVEVIPGDELIGMKLLERIGSKLIVDFDKSNMKLIG